jgi:predicted permease
MFQDLRFAIRSLSRAGGFTAAASLTLALGIAANTIVYSIVSGLVLRPLPFGERSHRLVTVHSTHPTQAQDWDDSDVSYADLLDIREAARSLEGVEGVLNRNFSLAAADQTERVLGASITPGLFRLLGVEPARGRVFRDDEGAAPGMEAVAIISHRLWERLYERDEAIVGRGIPINGREVTVVGVMPPRFAFPEQHDVWLPYRAAPPVFRAGRNLLAIGLLRPGVDLAEARAELATIASVLANRYPETNRDWGLHALPLRDLFITGDTRRAVTAMLVAVGFVLLVACANVASLLVARGIGREREFTVRIALGASRGRVTRLLLAESLVLSALGGALAMIAASWGLDALVASMPEPPVYWVRIQIDGPVLIFTLLLTTATAVACGLVPALRMRRLDITPGGLQTGRSSGATPEQRRLQGALVAGQVALSFALLVAATTLARSAMMLQHTDIGFDPSPLLSFRTYVAGDAYDDPVARAQAIDRIAARLAELPGAQTAAATGAIPGDDGGDGIQLVPPRPAAGPDERIGAHMVPITSAFFEALALSLVEGRAFTTAEMRDPTGASVIVNKRLADAFWSGESVAGRELRVVIGRETHLLRVIGVAPDLVYEELGEETAQSRLTVYVPYVRAGWRTMAFLVRANTAPATLANGARGAVRSVDPAFAAYDLLTMRERRLVTAWGERFIGRTFSAFALAALFLACLGAYGVTAHEAAQRTREIGVRLAIGATRQDIVRLLLGGGLRLAFIGAVAGLPLAIGAAILVEDLLFGVSAWEAGVWILLPMALVAAVLLASFLPAQRASRTDPAVALRHD